jgi:hypothetical protein
MNLFIIINLYFSSIIYNNINCIIYIIYIIKIYSRNLLNFDGQEKLIDELEDWKDKQMILFNEKVLFTLPFVNHIVTTFFFHHS